MYVYVHCYRATEKPRDLKAIRDSLTELLWGAIINSR